MLRAIREIQPTWVVGENVSGLVNWSGGMVFDEVQADLETEGYEVIPFILPACAVNAPHRRDRVWFVAHAINGGHSTGRGTEAEKNRVQVISREKMESREFDRTGIQFITTNPDSKLHERRCNQERPETAKRYIGAPFQHNTWQNFPTQSPIRTGNDGFSGRLDGITFSKWRNESIKAAGNAIVPQVALQIFKAIE